MLGKFVCFACRMLTFYSKNSSSNTIKVSNGLDQDQDRRYVGSDLGPNCLLSLSTDDKSHCYQGKGKILV